jgi:hypothetical protein
MAKKLCTGTTAIALSALVKFEPWVLSVVQFCSTMYMYVQPIAPSNVKHKIL